MDKVIHARSAFERKCKHTKFIVDESLNEVECGICGEKLNPIWVISQMAKEIGVTDAYISSVCLGQKTPNVQKLTHIARVLDMKLSELVALGEK